MRKNRSWTAFSAVVGLAALVVLASCQGPAGAAGAKGDPGATGPPGGTGTTDNMSPVATAIPKVYLALDGIAAPATAPTTGLLTPSPGYKTKIMTLATYFTDAESPTLSYKAVSTDPAIATVPKAPGKTLTITGVKAGTTTITVTAFDGVNEGVETTIDVIVVANNSPPTAGVIQAILDLTGPRKLVSDSAQTIAFTAAISPGVSGEPTEAIAEFRTVLDTGAPTVTKLVSAKVMAVSGNDYILTVTRLKSGTADVSGTQEITIFAQDSFGAETMIDLNGVSPASFIAAVNAPPRLAQALPDVVLYRNTDGGQPNTTGGDAAIAPTAKRGSTHFFISDYFAVEYAVAVDGANPAREQDTTCVFTTSPKQPTGLPAVTATPLTDPPVAGRAAGPIKATTMASVVENMPSDTPTELDRLDVDSSPDITGTNPDGVAAAGLGNFTLTITCSDAETSVYDTAMVTVRPGGQS